MKIKEALMHNWNGIPADEREVQAQLIAYRTSSRAVMNVLAFALLVVIFLPRDFYIPRMALLAFLAVVIFVGAYTGAQASRGVRMSGGYVDYSTRWWNLVFGPLVYPIGMVTGFFTPYNSPIPAIMLGTGMVTTYILFVVNVYNLTRDVEPVRRTFMCAFAPFTMGYAWAKNQPAAIRVLASIATTAAWIGIMYFIMTYHP